MWGFSRGLRWCSLLLRSPVVTGRRCFRACWFASYLVCKVKRAVTPSASCLGRTQRTQWGLEVHGQEAFRVTQAHPSGAGPLTERLMGRPSLSAAHSFMGIHRTFARRSEIPNRAAVELSQNRVRREPGTSVRENGSPGWREQSQDHKPGSGKAGSWNPCLSVPGEAPSSPPTLAASLGVKGTASPSPD